jgi:2,5-furandicarboxylate decarboxylase 1
MDDLRSFLDHVRKTTPTDLVEVEREVQPRYETTAILTKLDELLRSPILFFRHVAGSAFPVVTNVCGSRDRLAMALGCAKDEMSERFEGACSRPISPVVCEEGAVQECVYEGQSVDLRVLPQMVYHQNDSPQPYITGAIVVARDPETKRSNLSYHRLMIRDGASTGIFMERGHLREIYEKYQRAGEPMPIAGFIGSHPVWSMGALYAGSRDVEEYDVIGGLLGEPLEVVECITQRGLQVPSRAEFVLEGTVEPSESVEEGPFGEFTGLSTGKFRTPVFHVTALTRRSDAIYQDIVAGHMEHRILPSLGLERRVREVASRWVRRVQRVTTPAPLTVVIAIEKTDDAEPPRLIEELVKSINFAKHVIITDADLEIRDQSQLMRAIALNVQANSDVYVYPEESGTSCDPSSNSTDGATAKMGIDATRKLTSGRARQRNQVPQEILDRIDVSEFLAD